MKPSPSIPLWANPSVAPMMEAEAERIADLPGNQTRRVARDIEISTLLLSVPCRSSREGRREHTDYPT